MELIEIIITTLKLFVLFASIVVLISYFVYKIKDRKRIKPYSEVPAYAPPAEINEDHLENKHSRFQILNVESQPEEYVPVNVPMKKQVERNHFSSYPVEYRRKSANKSFDIYDRYSSNNFEPMHKIKL